MAGSTANEALRDRVSHLENFVGVLEDDGAVPLVVATKQHAIELVDLRRILDDFMTKTSAKITNIMEDVVSLTDFVKINLKSLEDDEYVAALSNVQTDLLQHVKEFSQSDSAYEKLRQQVRDGVICKYWLDDEILLSMLILTGGSHSLAFTFSILHSKTPTARYDNIPAQTEIKASKDGTMVPNYGREMNGLRIGDARVVENSVIGRLRTSCL
ncbi:hypothetical protein F0562_022517 [Nyssa sinensis]|uniref:Uncharacterized protein n=1 Tax=Nyssa sinensis TaxID=561372 RepID=A0A5J5BMU1_9ASTE|nr:hypothetical protein F0562_022517 [Nyssa sinensis]